MRRSATLTFALAAVAIIAGLALAAGLDRRPVAFSLDVPNNQLGAILAPGATLCQGPIRVPSQFDGLEAWLLPGGAVRVVVKSAQDGTQLAVRLVHLQPGASGATVIRLGSTVPARESAAVCITNAGRRRLAFEGGLPAPGSGRLRVSGQPVAHDIALLFLRPHPPSLLSQLPTVFTRAALFKLSWVGAWTFWILLAALPLAFLAMGRAIAAAAGEDPEPGGRP